MSTKNVQAAKRVKPGTALAETSPQQSHSDSECRTYDIEEAAKILGISRAGAYLYAKSGKLPVIRIGSRILVPKAALDKLLMCA
ncbi:MAG: helix-turn-helix domain-containing protein [Xanthobacteraceae bacterium]